MKKLEIMLLSLALFAVVGGALAFKEKFENDLCLGTPYQDASGFYCSHNATGQVTTVHCTIRAFSTTDQVFPKPIISCTTIPDLTLNCDILCGEKEFVEQD